MPAPACFDCCCFGKIQFLDCCLTLVAVDIDDKQAAIGRDGYIRVWVLLPNLADEDRVGRRAVYGFGEKFPDRVFPFLAGLLTAFALAGVIDPPGSENFYACICIG